MADEIFGLVQDYCRAVDNSGAVVPRQSVRTQQSNKVYARLEVKDKYAVDNKILI